MMKKQFFAAFLVFLSFSFHLYATDVENFDDVASDRFRDIWPLISSKLTDERDVVQVSRVCKLAHGATGFATAWEGVAQKYRIQPKQVRRYLELLSKYKGQEEIALGVFGALSHAFHLELSYVEKFVYTKQVVAVAHDYISQLPHRYIKVTDYVRLEVENEEMTARKNEKLFAKMRKIFEPTEISFKLKPVDMEKFFIKLEDE